MALGLDFQQLGRHVADFFGGFPFGLAPGFTAQRMQRRGVRRCAGIATDQMQLGDRHVQPVALGVFDVEVFAGLAAGFQRHQSAVTADAVVFMHHRRTFAEFAEVANDRFGLAARAFASTRLRGALGKQLTLGHDHPRRRAVDAETVVQRRYGDEHALMRMVGRVVVGGIEEFGERGDHARTDVGGVQHFEQCFATPGRIGGDQQPARIRRKE